MQIFASKSLRMQNIVVHVLDRKSSELSRRCKGSDSFAKDWSMISLQLGNNDFLFTTPRASTNGLENSCSLEYSNTQRSQ